MGYQRVPGMMSHRRRWPARSRSPEKIQPITPKCASRAEAALRAWDTMRQRKAGRMTKLTKPIARETAKLYGSTPVIVTLAPAGSQSEALIGLRLKGRRTQFVCALSDVYRMAALWHGQKEAAARRAARKEGVPWKQAKKKFNAANSLSPGRA